jgi:hypothetical protein
LIFKDLKYYYFQKFENMLAFDSQLPMKNEGGSCASQAWLPWIWNVT